MIAERRRASAPRRDLAGPCALVVVGLLLWPVEPASATEPGGNSAGQACTVAALNCPTDTADGYVYVYDAATGLLLTLPAYSDPAHPDAVYQYATTPACEQASPTEDVNCTGATTFCAANGEAGIHEDLWVRETAPLAGAWAVAYQFCDGSVPGSISTQELTADVSEYERDHMPIPKPNVQPATIALVNLPVIVSATNVGPQTLAVEQPVPGLLVALPTYSWKFNDGTTVAGVGTPFDGTDPRTDPAHYVSHTYEHADAHASVALTVTWNATFTAAGQTFTLPPLVMPPIVTNFTVDEAHSVLVSY
jgi:hypothetical protein